MLKMTTREDFKLAEDLRRRINDAVTNLQLASIKLSTLAISYGDSRVHEVYALYYINIALKALYDASEALKVYAPPEYMVMANIREALILLGQAFKGLNVMCRKPAKGRGVCKLTLRKAVLRDLLVKLSQIEVKDPHTMYGAFAAGYLTLFIREIRNAFEGYKAITGEAYGRARYYELDELDVTLVEAFLDLASLLEWVASKVRELEKYRVQKVNDIELLVHPNADVDLVNAVKLWAETANALYKKNFILKEDYELLGATVHTDWAFILMSGARRYAGLRRTSLLYVDRDVNVATALAELLNLTGIQAETVEKPTLPSAVVAKFPEGQLVLVAKLLALMPSMDHHVADLSPDEVEKYMLSIACQFIEEYDRVCMRP